MKSFTRTTRRAVLVSCVAGAAVIGAVGAGTAAFADGAPSPSTSQSASTDTTGTTGTAAAPEGGPAAGPEHGKHEPHIGGTVLTVTGSTVTVQDRDGFTRTVTLADGATVTKDGASSTAAAITTGAHIEATGSVASDKTTLTATAVRIGEPTPPKGGPGAPGGPRGGKHDRGDAPTPPKGAPTDAPTSAPTGAPADAPSGAAPAAPTPSTGS